MTDPLTGRLLMLDDPDGEYWSLSLFAARLTKHAYLMTALNPQDGTLNKTGGYVLDLRLICLMPHEEHARGKVFADFAAVRAFLDWVDEPPAEKVVKLVTKT